ncbi:hypothetical protein ALI22I_00755 [Saccharothrix sp. ALI-22-I]|nr:hypothetical protein ALI22I_00755 [Saccharothrix sp. ALI-22-I]
MLVTVLAAVLLSAGWGLGVFDRLGQGGYSDPDSEAAKVQERIDTTFGRQDADVIVVYTAPEGRTAADIGPEVTERLAGVDRALLDRDIQSFWTATPELRPRLVSGDGRSALALVSLKGTESERLRSFEHVADDLLVPGVDTKIAGYTAIADGITDQSEKDLIVAEAISLPVTLALLVFIFGGLVAASIPVLVGGLAIAGALGVLRLLSLFTEVSAFSVNIASLLGLGLAIDYGLFTVSRFREELAAGHAPPEATVRTVRTAGRTVGFSGVLLIVALGGLLFFPQAFLRSLGFGAMAAVAIAAGVSLAAVPAALAILGHRVDSLTWRKGAAARADERAQRFWGRVATGVMKRPVVITLAVTAVLLLLGTPLLGTKLGDIDHTTLPADHPARVGQEKLVSDFPGAESGAWLLIEGASPDAVRDVTSAAWGGSGVVEVLPVAVKDDLVLLKVALDAGDRTEEARLQVVELGRIADPPGTTVRIGGATALEDQGVESMIRLLPVMIAFMVVATVLLMFLAFGSVVLPLKAVLMTGLSLSATFGVLTWVFYDGYGADLIGVSTGPLVASMVVLITALVFGLSTDYEVFLMSRMVEARNRGATTEEAVRIGTAHTGRVVTSAALLLILVTGAFALSDLTMMRFVGLGMILALLIDATVVRMLLVPALIKLMGSVNWWAPGPLRRFQQRFGIREGE